MAFRETALDVSRADYGLLTKTERTKVDKEFLPLKQLFIKNGFYVNVVYKCLTEVPFLPKRRSQKRNFRLFAKRDEG